MQKLKMSVRDQILFREISLVRLLAFFPQTICNVNLFCCLAYCQCYLLLTLHAWVSGFSQNFLNFFFSLVFFLSCNFNYHCSKLYLLPCWSGGQEEWPWQFLLGLMRHGLSGRKRADRLTCCAQGLGLLPNLSHPIPLPLSFLHTSWGDSSPHRGGISGWQQKHEGQGLFLAVSDRSAKVSDFNEGAF